MFRKFEKTYHIILPPEIFSLYGPDARPVFLKKKVMPDADVKRLLSGRVTIEEKLDGANVGIILTGNPNEPFRLQKRHSLVDVSEHAQYNIFRTWAWEKYEDLAKLPKKYILYGELMWATHHVYYDQLPDWFIGYDIYDKQKREYVARAEKEEIFGRANIPVVSLLFDGHVSGRNDLYSYFRKPGHQDSRSAFSSTTEREGIVVKNYRKQMKAKIVRPNFLKCYDDDTEHWRTWWDPNNINKLAQHASTENTTSGG